MKSIFVDFDGTICPNKDGNSYPPPNPECIEVLKALKEAGNFIVIYSVRSNKEASSKPGGHEAMIEYLILHDVPFDSVDSSKPHFRMVIDDKGLGVPLDSNKNVDWSKAREMLEKRNYIFTKEAQADLREAGLTNE
jgi:hypothetical protein